MKNTPPKSSSRKSMKYEKPEVKSFSADELLEWIGPAQGIASGTRGIGNDSVIIDPMTVNKKPRRFGI